MGRVTATVLFTDLVGSTELRARLGEEPAEELRRQHDQLLTQAVEGHGGRVVKGLGDGIMATFAGASEAVAAAVSIQQRIDRLSRSGQAAVPLAVRVGLSAGDVTVEADDVHGTPVIEASRLCGAAGGGEIFASDLVRALAGSGSDARFESVGSLELKGLTQPVPVVRVGWEPAATSAIPMPGLLTDVGRIFVGRDAELERLTQLWKEAAAGDRRVVFLAGEPGVGKTRLTAELADRVHEQGGIVLAGRCDEDLGVPYQPFVEALRHFADHTAPGELANRIGRYGGELVRLLPDLTERLPGLAPPLSSDPDTERYRLFDAVAAWLAAGTEDQPVLLVLDDLQWAAKPTVLLLRHVARSSEGMRLLILSLYRDAELNQDHPLVQLLADLRREGAIERVLLGGLDQPGVTAFVEQVAGHDLDEDVLTLARAIHEETEGNPFFVKEVLRHLAESGAIERREGRWGTRLPVEDLGIPEGVREVVGKRLSRLSAEANRVLRAAAVVGTEFEPAVVQAASNCEEEQLTSALEEAMSARLVIEADGARYRFAHALVRDTLYHGLSAVRRTGLHRRVAEALEAVHAGTVDDHLPGLAHHWARASTAAASPEKAVDYATRAGDRALTQLAYDEAASYYHLALELLGLAGVTADEPRRLRLLICLGEAQRRAGDPAYRLTLFEAARLAKERDDADALVRAALANSRGYFSVAGRVDEERVELLEAALDAVRPDDTARRARLLANLAVELVWAPEPERRAQLITEALAMARRHSDSDPATLGHVLAMRFTPSAPADLGDDLSELAGVASRLDDPVLAFWAANWSAQNALVVGDRAGFDAAFDASVHLADDLRQPFLRWVMAMVRSVQSRIAGRLDDAEAHAREALEISQAGLFPDGFRVYGVQFFWIRYDQGRLDEVIDLLARAAGRADPDPLTLAALALARLELNQCGEARQVLGRLAADGFACLPSNYAQLYGLTMVAEACAGVGDAEQAVILHDHLTPHVGLVGTVWSGATGCVDHYLGLLAVAMDRFDEADARFAAATQLHHRLGAPTWLARTRLEWARLLLTRRQGGDTGRARDLLGQALATARELGLANVERRAVELLT